MHYDHTANANDYASATWLVQEVERDRMFAQPAPSSFSTYTELKNSQTTLLHGDHDVFGDGTVMIKSTPGHTAGHQSLFVSLTKTGTVLLSGDLYHYPEERALGVVPTFEFNKEQSQASRAAMEQFMKEHGAQLWIQHDILSDARLKKSPQYYEWARPRLKRMSYTRGEQKRRIGPLRGSHMDGSGVSSQLCDVS
jgi:N-acyl homoserine lactone hydrolase